MCAEFNFSGLNPIFMYGINVYAIKYVYYFNSHHHKIILHDL